jgi:hypothetical protein
MKLRWARYVARKGRKRNDYNNICGKATRKETTRKPKYRLWIILRWILER